MGQSCNNKLVCQCVCAQFLKGLILVLGVGAGVFVAFPTGKVIKKSPVRMRVCVFVEWELIISAKRSTKRRGKGLFRDLESFWILIRLKRRGKCCNFWSLGNALFIGAWSWKKFATTICVYNFVMLLWLVSEPVTTQVLFASVINYWIKCLS